MKKDLTELTQLHFREINMSVYALIIATLCYIVTALSNLKQKDYPHALVWFAYAVANFGLLWYEWNKTKA